MKKNILMEYNNPTHGFFISPRKKLFEGKSKFQKIEVFEDNFYGRILRLDNQFQTAEFDEFIYHEAITHFALFSHKNPKKVLIIGGGDGGALEEVLKHRIVNSITLVDIDKKVIEVSKKYLTRINKFSFEDKKVNVIIKDGLEYLKNTNLNFDIIILDITDPSTESKKLYTKEFYKLISNKLNKGGIFSLHAESPLDYSNLSRKIIQNLKKVFKFNLSYSTFVPIYGTIITFVFCSKETNFYGITKEVIEKRFKERKIKDLRLFTPGIFISSFVVPPYIKNIIY